MKSLTNLFLLTTLLCSLFFVSCSDDDAIEPSPKPSTQHE